MPWMPIAAPVLILARICKCALLLLLPMTVAYTAIRHGKERKLLRLAAIWGISLLVLISALAIGRQRLVLMTIHGREVRYVPASGNHPDVGLWAVTWPTHGSGPEWLSDDYESPLLKLYPKMWHSGQVYGRELMLAMLMVGLWVAVGEVCRRKISAIALTMMLSIGVLVLGQALNNYLVWDYDTFLLGIWSDSILLGLMFPLGSGPTALVFFLLALTVGASSWGAARVLREGTMQPTMRLSSA